MTTRISKSADHTPSSYIRSVHSLILEQACSTLGFFSVAFIKTLKSRLAAENRFVSWGMAMRRSRLENTYKNNNKSVSSPTSLATYRIFSKSLQVNMRWDKSLARDPFCLVIDLSPKNVNINETYVCTGTNRSRFMRTGDMFPAAK